MQVVQSECLDASLQDSDTMISPVSGLATYQWLTIDLLASILHNGHRKNESDHNDTTKNGGKLMIPNLPIIANVEY